MLNAIALAAHPANMDASAETVHRCTLNGREAAVFRVTGGFVPGYCGMTAPGYMPDAATAVEWLEAYAQEGVYPLKQKEAAE